MINKHQVDQMGNGKWKMENGKWHKITKFVKEK